MSEEIPLLSGILTSPPGKDNKKNQWSASGKNHCSSQLEYLQPFWLIFNALTSCSLLALPPPRAKGRRRPASRTAAYRNRSASEPPTWKAFIPNTHQMRNGRRKDLTISAPSTTHLETVTQSTRVLSHGFLFSSTSCLVSAVSVSFSPARISSLMPSAVLLFTFHPQPSHLFVFIHLWTDIPFPALRIISRFTDTSSRWWWPRSNCSYPKNEALANPMCTTHHLLHWASWWPNIAWNFLVKVSFWSTPNPRCLQAPVCTGEGGDVEQPKARGTAELHTFQREIRKQERHIFSSLFPFTQL